MRSVLRFAIDLLTFAVLTLGLTEFVHLMLVGLALIDPGKIPQ